MVNCDSIHKNGDVSGLNTTWASNPQINGMSPRKREKSWMIYDGYVG
jgi:hypothetical protein